MRPAKSFIICKGCVMPIKKESTAPVSRVLYRRNGGACHLSKLHVAMQLEHSTLRRSESGGQPSDDGIRELAAPEWHGPAITRRPVVSYTTFSPLPRLAARRLFSSAIFHCHQWLPLSEAGRPALPGLSSRTVNMVPATGRSTAFMLQKYINLMKRQRNGRDIKPTAAHLTSGSVLKDL